MRSEYFFMALTMIITGFWDVTPYNLPIFTEVLEENSVSVFGVEDVVRTFIFLTDGQISIKLHEDSQLKTFFFTVLSFLPLEVLFSKWEKYSFLIKQMKDRQMFIMSSWICAFHLTLLPWLRHTGWGVWAWEMSKRSLTCNMIWRPRKGVEV